MPFVSWSLFTKPQNLRIFSNAIIRQRATKTITGDTIQIRDKTLLGRIMSYLNTNDSSTSPTDCGINMINNLVHGRSSALRTLSVDQLTGLFYSANTNVISHSKQNMIRVLGLLDVECCLRINNMDSATIIKVLNAYMHVIPNRITDYKFYQFATDNFDRYLDQATPKDLLQFIFYIGLQKNSKKQQVMLKKCLRKINRSMLEDFTVEDLCIICNSTYRTQTKISNKKILDKVKETLNNNLYLLKDPALLITFIKTIKHNRCQDDDILSTIKCTMFFNQTFQYYTFPAMCHILSLYANDLYYDEDLLKLFMDRCVSDLQCSGDLKPKTAYLTEQLRPKDITRFLWILSTLNYKDIDEELFKNAVVPNIQKRMVGGWYDNHPEELTDTILYLRMLNYQANELMEFALSPERISHVKGTQSKNRLNLLLTIIKHQDEQLFNKLNIKRLAFSDYYQESQMQVRLELQRVFKTLNDIAHDLDINYFQMGMQIPHLNILGISAYTECKNAMKPKLIANVELLDDSNCVKNIDCWPSGYMKLKLEMLEQLSVPLITIQQSDIETLTEDELKTFLKEEFQMIIY